MSLRKAVTKNLVPALVITVVYEIAYPVLRPLVVTAIRVARTEVTKITRASEKSVPLSEQPPRVAEEPAPAPPVKSVPAATRPAGKGSKASATSTKQ